MVKNIIVTIISRAFKYLLTYDIVCFKKMGLVLICEMFLVYFSQKTIRINHKDGFNVWNFLYNYDIIVD